MRVRSSRKIFIAGGIFLAGIIILCLFYRSSPWLVMHETSVDKAKEIIKTVIPALEALETKLPVSGRGTAIMETENYLRWLDGKKLTVDFVFKGQNSRWDTFEWDNKNTSSRLGAKIVTEKNYIYLESDNVTINPTVVHNSDIHDFHPMTFLTLSNSPIKTKLQNTVNYDFKADPEQYVSISINDKGIIQITSGGPVTSPKDKGLFYEYQMSFDSKRDMVPVFFRQNYKSPKGTSSSMVNIEWTKDNSKWYVSRVEYNSEPNNRDHRIFTIKNFISNVEVSDQEFLLSSLNIPNGMRVIDRISDLTYEYKKSNETIQDAHSGLTEP
jgi:hypothetical protein